MTYWREIDGLRGLAVAMVIAYHAHSRLFSGGYVGVDVFFVISGFLITGLVTHEIDRGTFKLSSFFARRTRRIVPALLLVGGATLAVGCFIEGPTDLRKLAQSVVAASLFVPNVYFWKQVGYFEERTPEQPLLHTWSLGVEEQFYVLLPFLLLAIATLPSRVKVRLLCACIVASGVGSIALTGAHAAAAFYLVPTRIWELLLGGLLPFIARAVPRRSGVEDIAAIAGLSAIIIPAVLLSRTTPYPGVAAVLPCFGAAAVIWSCRSGRAVIATVLGNRMIVFIGLISYSLYLWHWPVLTLARYRAGRDLNAAETACAIVGIGMLAYLTWRFVETPFRSRAIFASARSWWLSAALSVAALAALGGVVGAVDGLPGRISQAALVYDRAPSDVPSSTGKCHHGPPAVVSFDQLCEFGSAHRDSAPVLLWGDSHANALVPVMRQLSEEHHWSLLQASYSSCPPLLGVGIAHTATSHNCKAFNDTVLQSIDRLGIRRVILAAYWTAYVNRTSDSRVSRLFDPYSGPGDLGGDDQQENQIIFSRALGRTIEALTKRGVEIWIVRQVPLQQRFVPNALVRAVRLGQDPATVGIPLWVHQQNQSWLNGSFARVSAEVRFVDPASVLCKRGLCICAWNGRSLYIDDNHLSTSGAIFLRPALQAIFH